MIPLHIKTFIFLFCFLFEIEYIFESGKLQCICLFRSLTHFHDALIFMKLVPMHASIMTVRRNFPSSSISADQNCFRLLDRPHR